MTNDRKKQAADILGALSNKAQWFDDDFRLTMALLAKELYEDEDGYDLGYLNGWQHGAEHAARAANKIAAMSREDILGD